MTEKKKILCVGFFTIDFINYVSHPSIEDCKINVTAERKSIGGNATNSANILKQLNANVDLCAVLAKGDPEIEKLFSAANLTTDSCFFCEGKCPSATIIVNEASATRTIFIHPQNVPEIGVEDFASKFSQNLKDYSWIHFEGRNFQNIGGIMKFINDYKMKNKNDEITVSVEFEHTSSKPWFEPLIMLANVIFISKEFVKSKGWMTPEAAFKGMRERYPESRNVTLICAWGEEGAYGVDANSDHIERAPAPQIIAVDTLGAGDCFNAGFIWAKNQKLNLLKSLQVGVYVASGKCEQREISNLTHLKNSQQILEKLQK